jgi:NAD(P)-dependent dehydrogenase (short-subunit alcohol dehydrogenase family)
MTTTPVAIVTGAASGIGKAVAEAYAAQGTAVVLTDVQDEAGEALAQQLRDGGAQATYVHCDVSQLADHQKAVKMALDTYGRLDYAVNNAGIGGDQGPTADYPVESWQKVLDINLTGPFLGMKAQIPAIIASGGGAIVNVASILGMVGFSGAPAYTTAKHGLVGLTRAAALDHSAQGVRINVVGPGFIHTPMISGLEENPDMAAMLAQLHPIGRIGEPEEVANVIVFLTSPAASFVTGSYYAIDGAYLAR